MLEIFITVNGEESLLGGACVCALAFEHGIPESLSKYIKKRPLNTLSDEDTVTKILEYKDYFTYSVDFLEPYQGIDKYRRVRLSAQNLALNIKYSLRATNLKIYQARTIGKSTDFSNIEIVRNYKSHVGISICHALAYYERRKNLYKLSLAYPDFEIMSHLGNKSPKHYEVILQKGLLPMHDEKTMEYVARYIQVQIDTYCDTDGYTHYKKYFKSLPHWWRVASGKNTLREYFTDKEIDKMFKNLYWCKQLYLKQNASLEDQMFKIPNIRPFPKQFKEFLEETNPYDDTD